MDNDSATGTVLGIDAGFSTKKKTTCLCLLEWGQSRVSLTWELAGVPDNERLSTLRRLVPEGTLLQAVAIDGPLTHRLALIFHYRSAEALLSRGVFQRRGKPGQTSSRLGQELHTHATTFANLVLDIDRETHFSVAPSRHFRPIHEKAIVEAFPNQFLGALVPEEHIPKINRDASDRFWEVLIQHGLLNRLVSRLLPGRVIYPSFEGVLDHEYRAGVVCALTALCVARGLCVGVGDLRDGYIYLPPADTWGAATEHDGSWMEGALRANLPKVKKVGGNAHMHHEHAEVISFDGVWLS